jgi:hypothetical protein
MNDSLSESEFLPRPELSVSLLILIDNILRKVEATRLQNRQQPVVLPPERRSAEPRLRTMPDRAPSAGMELPKRSFGCANVAKKRQSLLERDISHRYVAISLKLGVVNKFPGSSS